mgnify:CR=1 FL=1
MYYKAIVLDFLTATIFYKLYKDLIFNPKSTLVMTKKIISLFFLVILILISGFHNDKGI